MQRKPAKDQMEPQDEKEDEVQPESEVFNFDRPDYVFKPNEVHSWRQEGPYIICKSCELIHATFIGMDKWLVGLNSEGQQLFKKKI